MADKFQTTETKTLKAEEMAAAVKDMPDLFGTRLPPLFANRVQVIISDEDCRLVFGAGLGNGPHDGVAHSVIVMTPTGIAAVANAINEAIERRRADQKAKETEKK